MKRCQRCGRRLPYAAIELVRDWLGVLVWTCGDCRYEADGEVGEIQQ